MKKYKIISIFIIVLSLFSCEEYLDVNPEMGISADEVYSEYTSFRGAVDVAAKLMINPVQQANLGGSGWKPGGYSDEGQISGITRLLGSHNLGDFENFDGDIGFKNDDPLKRTIFSTISGLAVQAIRSVNQALENADKLTVFPLETEYSEQELKNQLFGQCHFYRAYHYFEIIRRYGGMPIMDRVFSSDENFDVERPSYQESTDWLVEDLDKAIELLPDSWNLRNKGRPTKTTARALKAMALLYAASPNMNLPYGANPTGGEGYNETYLERAVTASVEAIKSAEASSDYRMMNWSEYGEIWVSKTNALSPESILQQPIRKNVEKNVGNAGSAWFKPQFDGGWIGNQIHPTQNAVNWFETVDGYDIKDAPLSSYDPQDPYTNRDPRLRELIYVNGDDMYLKATAKDKYLESYVSFDPSIGNGYHYNYMIVTKGYIWTGYTLKGKHRWAGNNNQDKISNVYRMFPLIRFAQLYLDLAEAANELYGSPTATIPGAGAGWSNAVNAVNMVRTRANMPNVRAEYTTSKDVFRERVRNERAVEFFWEGLRWHDIKRWRIAKDVLKEIKGVHIVKTASTLEYGEKVLPGVRVFEDKHYWYPFSQATEDMMTVFQQNPGW